MSVLRLRVRSRRHDRLAQPRARLRTARQQSCSPVLHELSKEASASRCGVRGTRNIVFGRGR
jgi:hypothetical protein